MSQRIPVFGLVVCLCLMGCAGAAFRRAVAEDTVGAYHRFLRDHGESNYADEARARLDFSRVRGRPSREAFVAFEKKHAGSPLVTQLRPFVAEHFLRAARAEGTPEAYRRFLGDFPGGALAVRARGNAVYLEARGFGGDAAKLTAFAEQHPESDYAAEALRSVAGIEARARTHFRRAGLVVDVDPSTPGADRVRRVFSERATAAYRSVGIELVPLAGREDAAAAGLPARITIAHSEKPVRSELKAGTVSSTGILARTTVTVERASASAPIWQRSFEHRASTSERKATTSILFGAGTSGYWRDFFVPVVTWDTARAVREPRAFRKPAVAVELVGSRAVVAFGDGDFQVFDLSDPSSPAPLAHYKRPRDLAVFDGVRLVGGRIAIFGPDGLEIVRLIPDGPVRESFFGRDVVGSILGVEGLGEGIVAAGNRGLIWIGADGSLGPILSRPVLGLARRGAHLLFTDGQSLYVASVASLKAGRVDGELRLGRGFHPGRVRASGETAVVLGRRGTAWVDLRSPGQPRLLSRIETLESGDVADATLLGGRLFLLGARGLQVSDRAGERLIDSVDVGALRQLSADGRHLALVGEQGLQVVDATPFLGPVPTPASR